MHLSQVFLGRRLGDTTIERERELHSLIKVHEVRAAFRAAYAPGSLTSWHVIIADERIKAALSIARCAQPQTDRHRQRAGNSSWWAVMPCALALWFLPTKLHGVTLQKTTTFLLTTARNIVQ